MLNDTAEITVAFEGTDITFRSGSWETDQEDAGLSQGALLALCRQRAYRAGPRFLSEGSGAQKESNSQDCTGKT